jgi:hypothetical protein
MTVEWTHIGAPTATGVGLDATQSIAFDNSRR